MEPQRKTAPRIWVILAREASFAAVFRRGPSGQVRLLKWNLRNDAFHGGQWFKGRIYERRCDLSPDGSLLIYFASKQSRQHLPTWTAISKPPYLTALAMWPKGDCWNGGGQFLTNHSIILDHEPYQAELAPGFHLKKIRIAGLLNQKGEDSPMWNSILQRDGWTFVNRGRRMHKSGWQLGWQFDPPETWTKPHPKKPLLLEMGIRGLASNGKRGWYQMGYQVLPNDRGGLPAMDADWADWDKRGDLLYARNGKIFRQRHRQTGFESAIELIDLNNQKFENIAPPASALKW
ncbi:MAG TPA: hypothetical protein VG733_18840 [Chthoniobacteraceae bacterium]|nr:hypothetical protein [Chthoniobacteraceae bacterium]